MTRAVLADTGPLYALADPADQFHQRAHKELQAILEAGNRVIVTYPVLCEAHTLVLRRLGGPYSRQWLSELLEGGTPLNPEPEDYFSSVLHLERYADQPLTLVDAVTAVISHRLEVPVWSFDRHFVIMRSRIWRIH